MSQAGVTVNLSWTSSVASITHDPASPFLSSTRISGGGKSRGPATIELGQLWLVGSDAIARSAVRPRIPQHWNLDVWVNPLRVHDSRAGSRSRSRSWSWSSNANAMQRVFENGLLRTAAVVKEGSGSRAMTLELTSLCCTVFLLAVGFRANS
ncbi:hypothetical protein BJX70DRAFT_8322 [Aspergillus crustosus]